MERILWGCACFSTYFSFKQDVGEDGNPSRYDVKNPPTDDTTLAQSRKIPRNPLPKESQTPIFEAKVGGQTITSKAEVETEVTSANSSTNSNVSMPNTQQVTQPSGDCEVDHGVVDNPSYIQDDHGVVDNPSYIQDHQVILGFQIH
ncbi:hypothetical protein L3X38_025830 [Prunus dulcis]|uniref:Uncharacterized protein n=1 Tax=Prunus dulcis TaxID=3755 RepID=A0AAD4W382_PRUDU|nr:hypothetical protein L3X38_025830 [Prunus dulcis]